MKYAENTKVDVNLTRLDIEKTLLRFGAENFAYATKEGVAMILFEFNGKRIRFLLNLPKITDEKFKYTPSRGTLRTSESQFKEWEQACKQKWRALLLVIKAKLTAIDDGISTFEDEFMANILLPNGKTVSEHCLPKIEEAYISNALPPMIDFGGSL